MQVCAASTTDDGQGQSLRTLVDAARRWEVLADLQTAIDTSALFRHLADEACERASSVLDRRSEGSEFSDWWIQQVEGVCNEVAAQELGEAVQDLKSRGAAITTAVQAVIALGRAAGTATEATGPALEGGATEPSALPATGVPAAQTWPGMAQPGGASVKGDLQEDARGGYLKGVACEASDDQDWTELAELDAQIEAATQDGDRDRALELHSERYTLILGRMLLAAGEKKGFSGAWPFCLMGCTRCAPSFFAWEAAAGAHERG